jgi:hypothetical protein
MGDSKKGPEPGQWGHDQYNRFDNFSGVPGDYVDNRLPQYDSNSRGGGCYSLLSSVTMYDRTKKHLNDLRIGDQILTLNSRGKLVPDYVKKIIISRNFLYTITYGHFNKEIRATANHKFRTYRGAVRVDNFSGIF